LNVRPFWGYLFLYGILAFGTLSTEYFQNATSDLLFRIRGERCMSDRFLLIHIDEKDIQDLGGWPISRDYYGYLIHALTQNGARVIAFDLLLDQPDPHYPESDTLLADFIQSAGMVCLPMVFNQWHEKQTFADSMKHSQKTPFAEKPVMPYTMFEEQAGSIGFSNFDPIAKIRKVPLVAYTHSGFYYALGLEMARLYLGSKAVIQFDHQKLLIQNSAKAIQIPVDDTGRMRLNYYGKISNVPSIRLVNFLKLHESSPDSSIVQNKIVLIAVTAPSMPVLKSTPISPLYPASLIHATVAENILSQDFLVSTPLWISCLLLAVAMGIITLLFQKTTTKWAVLLSVCLLIFYLCTASIVFVTYSILLPLAPFFVGSVIMLLYWLFLQQRQQHRFLLVEQRLLRDRMSQKEKRLDEASDKLKSLEIQIQKELKEKETLSKKSRQLIKENKALVLEVQKQIRDLEAYQSRKVRRQTKHEEIIHSPNSKLSQILELIDKMKSDDIPVLISGQTGTGKELIAHAIHRSSARRRAPFVAINCGALPDTLLESELFGHERGSFTGAHKQRKGRFELAHGGTIFLDEITETSPAFQARLLRVLQEKTFERVGGEKPVTVNIRIIAATHKDIQKEIEEERFRKDLFYRLNGFPITLPSLHDRVEDIPLLCSHFLEKHQYKDVVSLSDRVMDVLRSYHWPGNVRELENVIRRAAILAQSENRAMIQEKDLPIEVIQDQDNNLLLNPYQSMEDQVLRLLRTLQFSRSAIQKTAEALGNRDRGTITEYFRGICFQYLVENDFNIQKAARQIADTDNKKIIQRVQSKIIQYFDNLKGHLHELKSFSQDQTDSSIFKGLPKKFHPALQAIIKNYHLIQQ